MLERKCLKANGGMAKEHSRHLEFHWPNLQQFGHQENNDGNWIIH